MNEASPESNRYPELSARAPELGFLVMLCSHIDEIVRNEIVGKQHGADFAMDLLGDYCKAVAHRDPETGHAMLVALELNERVSETAFQIADRLRDTFGIPTAYSLPPETVGQPEDQSGSQG